MAFGGGTKPATMVKPLKTVQMSHKGPPLNLPKPKASAKGRGSTNGGCCGK
jgi:hypothetical protein